jgi:hypothetical protein
LARKGATRARLSSRIVPSQITQLDTSIIEVPSPLEKQRY